MSYGSNNNAVLIDGCTNLQNPSVLLKVTEDIATTDRDGWSFSLRGRALADGLKVASKTILPRLHASQSARKT